MARSSSQDEEYTPFDDDYRGFDAREDETARGPLILTLAIGVLLIFGAVVWNTYRQGIRPEGEGLPSVLAEEAPFKKAPEAAGGAVVANTEIRFFDKMDASSRDPVPELSAPVVELAGAGAAGDGLPANLRRGPVEPITELGAAPATPPAGETPAPQDPATSEAVVAAIAPAAVTAPQGPRVRFAFASGGDYLVQIAALRSEEAAETAWKRVTASAPELYYGATKVIQRADLGSEGVFYRLRVGAFADRSEASAFCDAVKDAGANCIVVNG
ncbi:MAG: SPOR domain-containing protein [Hyphomonas sp.]|uniref:SPOR domain-containing protein n=1 Tax=Hyphomonas sp. TaxID=87 RepID=UPI0034A08AB4